MRSRRGHTPRILRSTFSPHGGPIPHDGAMALPIILGVEDEADVRGDLERDLAKRYSADYQVLTSDSHQRGLEILTAARRDGTAVAIVIASQRMQAMRGIDFLVQAHELHPH